MKLAIKIAKRFLLSNKSQSILIICAIAIGISVQLFIGLLIQGLQVDLINSTIGDASHITITEESDFVLNEDFVEKISDTDGIKSVSPILYDNAFMSVEEESYSVILNGVDIETNIFSLEDKVVEGVLPENNDEIILGKFYEEIDLGESVEFALATGEVETFEVVGKFDFGNSTVNEKSVYMSLEALQTFSGKNEVSAILTQVDEVFLSEEVASEIDYNGKNVVTWQEENASLLTALSSQSMSSVIIQVFIVISVTLAISSVLIISVVQKSKQIGILKAMGLNDASISKVFVTQGFMLGAIGSLFGVILGILLSYSFSTFAVDEFGNSVISILYSPSFIALSFFIGVSVSTIASLIPAQKSRKLSAMEVIGNG